VRDNHGATTSASAVQIQPGNTAPTPVIETPASGARFRVGENVLLHGSATDAQDGSLGAGRLSWRVLRHHGTSHTHPWLPDTTGNDIPISTPGPEDLATTTTSFLEVRLTATDSQGLSTTVTREFRPTLVDLTFATQPSGLDLELNGETVTGPYSFSSWEGWAFPVSARRQQDDAGATWVFDHWSDAGAATHTITTGAVPATYTATFRPNAAPSATGSSVSTPEDTAKAVTLNATDPDGDAVTFAIERSPSLGTLGPIVGSSVTYTPAANANGEDSFDFSASDGAATSPDRMVSITVTEVNDPPDAVNDTTSVAEDTSVLVNVRANDSKGPPNESAQTLSVSSVTNPPHGTATIESGSVRYAPDANYFGPDSFGYQVCDNGTTNGVPAVLCDSGTIGVTVSPVNDSPVALDDTAFAPAGSSVLLDVVANDTDLDGNPLGLTAVTPGPETNGAVGVEAGKARYTPTAGFSGQARFDYTVSDGAGGTDIGTVVVTVGDAAPIATDVVAAAIEDAEASLDLVASDPNGDPLTFQVVAVPARGTIVALTGRTARYLPAANYHGPDSFTFRATDGGLQSNVATVSLTVHEVNDPPSAAPDSMRPATDAPIVIDVLANDVPGPADEGGQALTLAVVGAPTHGTATPTTGGLVLYTPSPSHNGPDTFLYTVCDNGRSGGLSDPRCATATVDFAFSEFPLPRNVAAPRVVGGARAGTVAVAAAGDWDSALLAVEYRWLRCPPPGRAGCTAIPGAAGSRYRVRLADIGKVLRVRVTTSNRFGSSGETSAPGRPVGSPVVLAAVRHRGDDWVLLRNETRTSVSLRGWKLGDSGGVVHTLGRVTIGPLRVLRVDTRDVWGAGDRATLRLPSGRIVDTCAYRMRAAVARC
jgi:hypothetical protein